MGLRPGFRTWGLIGAAVLVPVLMSASYSAVSADQYTQQIAQDNQQLASLAAQAASLQGQLAGVNARKGTASADAVATQKQIEALQQQMQAAQVQLNAANARWANTSAQVTVVHGQVVAARAHLASVVRQLYLESARPPLAQAAVSNGGVQGVVDVAITFSSLEQEVANLTTTVESEQSALLALQAQEQIEVNQADALVNSLAQENSQLQSDEAQYQAEVASLTGQSQQIAMNAQAIVQKIQNVQQAKAQAQANEAAALAAAAARAAAAAAAAYGSGAIGYAAGPGSAAASDHFPWGQCTWYVASQVYVPWYGNADQWVAGAESYGYPVGMTPQVGAIVVWGPGGLYDPYYGHVAYVVAVQGPSSFTVDEANYYVPNGIDQRQVNTLYDVEGFIYQPSS